MAPAQLVEEIRKTEAGKMALAMGDIAYCTYATEGKLIISGKRDEAETRKLFYAVAAYLEDSAMREVFNKRWR